MSRACYLTVVMLCACAFLAPAVAQEKLAQAVKSLTVIDPDGDCKITLEGPRLSITVPKAAHDLTYDGDYTKLNAPRILQEVKGDFAIDVRVIAFIKPLANTSSSGRHSFVSSGLVIWQDEGNFIRFERAAEGNGGTLFVWVERFQAGKSAAQKLFSVADKDTFLRVERAGKDFTFAVKQGADEQQWKVIHTEKAELAEKLMVGVHAINTTTRDFSGYVEILKVNTK